MTTIIITIKRQGRVGVLAIVEVNMGTK